MKLKEIFTDMRLTHSEAAIAVGGISDDSRLVRKKDIFFVMPRRHFNIMSVLKTVEDSVSVFIAPVDSRAAIEKLHLGKPVIFVKNIRKRFLQAVERAYPYEKKRIEIIGITGTNGKTTTAFCLYHMLRMLRRRVSLIGSIYYYIGNTRTNATHTTPDFLQLRKMLHRISAAGGGFLIMEVSSHAIDQERTGNLVFSRCVFTNLGRDHLDYHHTMADYFNVKKRFFLQQKDAQAVINADDPYGRKILRVSNNTLSYGIHEAADIRITDIETTKNGSRFTLRETDKSYPVYISLCGLYNVYNVVAALTTLRSFNFPAHVLCEAVRTFRGVTGRLQTVAEDIFVDYAHTPDALHNVLTALKHMGYKNIICVFGCGGDRDKGKRSRMGSIAVRHSAYTIITSDNPRSEDAGAICRHIAAGCVSGRHRIIVDRRRAITKALELLGRKRSRLADTEKHSWCVLVAGKGHENYQIVGNKRFPFKDAAVIKQLCKPYRS